MPVTNLEALVGAECFDRFGRLPACNLVRPRLLPDGPVFDWHAMARRRSDVRFDGVGNDPSPAPRSRSPRVWTVADVRKPVEKPCLGNAPWTMAHARQAAAGLLARDVGPAASTPRARCAGQVYGNPRLN